MEPWKIVDGCDSYCRTCTLKSSKMFARQVCSQTFYREDNPMRRAYIHREIHNPCDMSDKMFARNDGLVRHRISARKFDWFYIININSVLKIFYFYRYRYCTNRFTTKFDSQRHCWPVYTKFIDRQLFFIESMWYYRFYVKYSTPSKLWNYWTEVSFTFNFTLQYVDKLLIGKNFIVLCRSRGEGLWA